MKKVALLMAMVVLVAASVSAAPKIKKVAAPKPVLSAPSVSTPAPATSQSSSGGNLAVGTDLGFPTIQYSFNKEISGQLGLMYASGGGVSKTAFLVKIDYSLASVGQALPTVGVFYASDGAAAATTSLGIACGIGTMVASNLKLGIDVVAVSSCTTGGASATGVLGSGGGVVAGAMGIPGINNSVSLVASYYL